MVFITHGFILFFPVWAVVVVLSIVLVNMNQKQASNPDFDCLVLVVE